ncbi:hypothetical protein ABZP36_030054 [Zizania latifolia]
MLLNAPKPSNPSASTDNGRICFNDDNPELPPPLRNVGLVVNEEELPPVERYKLAKANVDDLHLLQLSITICDHNGRLRVIDGVDFDNLRAHGVPTVAFARVLIDHGIVSTENHGWISWVAFRGLYDFGFLLKILTRNPLLETGKMFKAKLCKYLGNMYDAKYVAAQLPVCPPKWRVGEGGEDIGHASGDHCEAAASQQEEPSGMRVVHADDSRVGQRPALPHLSSPGSPIVMQHLSAWPPLLDTGFGGSATFPGD